MSHVRQVAPYLSKEAEPLKSCYILKPYQYELRESAIPEPESDQVQIKMMASGVCGSDVHIFRGENPLCKYPLIPGHENVGIVTKTGSGCSRLKVGDHVVVDLVISCGHCFPCRHGRRNMCESLKVRGSSADGGWREYWNVEEEFVYKIADHIPWRDAALIEPLAIGEHAAVRAGIQEDDTVFVLGSGTIGTIIVQTCALRGVKTVICCSRNDETLERAKLFGATHVINSKRENIPERVTEIPGGHGVTVAFDAACYPGSLSGLFVPGLVGNAGRIVNMGFSPEPESITQNDINKREITVVGSRMSTGQFQPVAEKMARGEYRLEGLATNFFRFDEVEQVFHYMEFPDRAVKKMVILFDGAED